jgi:hypothetical protein
MGLFDRYFDPEQFRASGGLLGRLLSLPQMQGLHQRNVDPETSAGHGQGVGAQMPGLMLRSNEPIVGAQAQLYGSARDIPLDSCRTPQFGGADVSPAMVAFRNGTASLSSGRSNAEGYSGADFSGNARDFESETISMAGEPPPGLSEIGYFEVPTNPNQAFGEP